MQYCRNYKSTNWANEHFGDFRRSRTLALLTTANVHGMPHASVNVSQSAQGCTKRHVATQAIAITENSKCTEWRARLLRLCGQLCLVGAHRSGARERWACCMRGQNAGESELPAAPLTGWSLPLSPSHPAQDGASRHESNPELRCARYKQP